MKLPSNFTFAFWIHTRVGLVHRWALPAPWIWALELLPEPAATAWRHPPQSSSTTGKSLGSKRFLSYAQEQTKTFRKEPSLPGHGPSAAASFNQANANNPE